MTIHPSAAMQLDHHRERSAALGLEETCQEGLITVPQIFHVFDLDFIGGPVYWSVMPNSFRWLNFRC